MANVNTINFGGLSNADLQAQQADLQRRQQYSEMLRQQAMSPIQQQQVSGRVVQTSPLEGLAKLAQAWIANSAQNSIGQKQAALGEEGRKRSADALRSLAPAGVFNDAASAPTQPLSSEPQMSIPGQQQPQVSPDLRERWVRALATYQQNPELGGKLIQELSKPAEFSTTPQYDQAGKAFVLNNQGERKMLDGVSARDKMEIVNGVWENPFQQQQGALAPQDPNAPFQINAGGQPVANMPYQQYQMQKARAAAPNIVTKVENKAAESIASQIGPMLKESATMAEGAVGQIDAADRVIKALDGNKVFAGPLASKRLTLSQIGQTLGIGGKDDAEVIANTRQVIRGMSEMTLQGRKQMSGQGAITESESKLAEKATSGDIDSLTPAELKIIASASRRAAQHTLSNHQRKVNKARSNPATAGIAEYFDTPGYESSGVDDLLKKYGGQ
jgi:hypothetical protein